MKILHNINLWKKSTIWIWWEARYYCEAKREWDLMNAKNFADKNDLWIIFFWIWSNLLFSQDITDKLVCRIKNNFFEKIWDSSENWTHFNFEEEFFEKNKKIFTDEKIFQLTKNFLNFNKENLHNWWEEFWIFKVWSWTVLWNLINTLIKDNFDLTNLAWFPSTIWWAIVWNAWLCWSEMKDFLVSANVLNIETWKIEEWTNKDFEFEYRNSKIKKFVNENEWINNFIISDCVLKIPKTRLNKEDWLKLKLTRNLQERADKQPKWRSAWSFFKNPYPHFAWKLIEQVWLKWFKIWWASFSWKHANFLMTKEWVTVKDILKLRNLAKRRVKADFWIELEEEIIIY